MSLSGGALAAAKERGGEKERRHKNHKAININLMLFINAAFTRSDKTLLLY
jgi:hypothetical protein